MKGVIFTYLLTFGGALFSLINPYYGFLIYVLFANIKPDFLWHHNLATGNYSRIVAMAFLFGWALHGTGSWTFKRATSVVVSIFIFWIWIWIGATVTPRPAQIPAWDQFWILTKVFLPIIAALTLVNSVDRLKELVWVLVISNGYLAFEFNITYYTQGIDPLSWNFAGLDNNCIAISMVSAGGLAVFVGLTAEKWWQRAIAFGCAMFMAHTVLFSMSRGGMLAMGTSAGVAFLLIPKKPVHYFMLCLGLVVVLRLAGPEVREEFLSIFAKKEVRDASAQSRFDLTRDALDCMMKHPVMGCGMENWGNMAPNYGWPKGKRVHNLWAEYGATLGIPGLAAYLFLYFNCCWQVYGLTRESKVMYDPWIHGMARAVISSLAGYLVTISFLSAGAVEIPYYIVMVGASVLKLSSVLAPRRVEAPQPVTAPLPQATSMA